VPDPKGQTLNRLLLGIGLTWAVLFAFHTRQPETVEQVTTTVPVTYQTVVLTDPPTTTSTITTTTIPVLVGPDTPCQEWVPLALEVGWPADRQVIEKLLAVMHRESRCTPDVISPTKDYGLMQINRSAHHARIESWGWTMETMLDPRANLTYALWLFNDQGWRPWRFSGGA